MTYHALSNLLTYAVLSTLITVALTRSIPIKRDGENGREWELATCRLGVWSYSDFFNPTHRLILNVFHENLKRTGDRFACDDRYHYEDDLQIGLAWIQSYKVSGDCTCTFYDPWGHGVKKEEKDKFCGVPVLFEATNQQDADQKAKPELDSKIDSWRCRDKPGETCRVAFYSKEKLQTETVELDPSWFPIGSISQPPRYITTPNHWSQPIHPLKNDPKNPCSRVPEDLNMGGQSLNSFEVWNCHCNFYENDNCEGETFFERSPPNRLGQSTVDSVKGEGLEKRFGSYRCLHYEFSPDHANIGG